MDNRSSSMPDNDFGSFDEAPENDPDATRGEDSEADASLSLEAATDAELERLEAAVTAERDKHLRLAAEFDNYRKRMIRERQESGAKAQADVVQGLVEVLDDIARFAHLDPASVDS